VINALMVVIVVAVAFSRCQVICSFTLSCKKSPVFKLNTLVKTTYCTASMPAENTRQSGVVHMTAIIMIGIIHQ